MDCVFHPLLFTLLLCNSWFDICVIVSNWFLTSASNAIWSVFNDFGVAFTVQLRCKNTDMFNLFSSGEMPCSALGSNRVRCTAGGKYLNFYFKLFSPLATLWLIRFLLSYLAGFRHWRNKQLNVLKLTHKGKALYDDFWPNYLQIVRHDPSSFPGPRGRTRPSWSWSRITIKCGTTTSNFFSQSNFSRCCSKFI